MSVQPVTSLPPELVCFCGKGSAGRRDSKGITHEATECLSQLDRIERNLNALIEAHNDVVTKVNDVVTAVQPHLDTIGPMLDQLQSHPMFRMFVGR